MNSDLQTLIASVGFPIALSMYLLVRIEGKPTETIRVCKSEFINTHPFNKFRY